LKDKNLPLSLPKSAQLFHIHVFFMQLTLGKFSTLLEACFNHHKNQSHPPIQLYVPLSKPKPILAGSSAPYTALLLYPCY